jgi:hypothetical protein
MRPIEGEIIGHFAYRFHGLNGSETNGILPIVQDPRVAGLSEHMAANACASHPGDAEAARFELITVLSCAIMHEDADLAIGAGVAIHNLIDRPTGILLIGTLDQNNAVTSEDAFELFYDFETPVPQAEVELAEVIRLLDSDAVH